MQRGTLAVAVAVCLSGSPVWAQARRAATPPLHFNNPTNQTGMYNNSNVLKYNNPLNQAGMYNNSALFYNNPLNQAGMYQNPALRYNNPLNQAGLYNGANWNNPLYQGNFNYGGFNNPLSQGGFGYGGFNNSVYQGNFNNGGFNNATTQVRGFNGINTGVNRGSGGVVGTTRNNADASAILNGNGKGGQGANSRPAQSGNRSGAKRKATSRRR